MVTHDCHFVPQLKFVYGTRFCHLTCSWGQVTRTCKFLHNKFRKSQGRVIHPCNKHMLSTYYASCTLLSSKDAGQRTYSVCKWERWAVNILTWWHTPLWSYAEDQLWGSGGGKRIPRDDNWGDSWRMRTSFQVERRRNMLRSRKSLCKGPGVGLEPGIKWLVWLV